MISDVNVKGTSHKIGGVQADGQWTYKGYRVCSGAGTEWSTGTQTFAISNYLPDNEYVYEVLAGCYAYTRDTSGASCSWWLGDKDGHFEQVLGYARTRATGFDCSGISCIIPLQQVNDTLTVKVRVTGADGGGTGYNGLYLYGYRRMGKAFAPAVYHTLTINPTPADATVTFNKGTVSGNTCTVTEGAVVTYTVSKSGYTTQSGTVTVGADQTVNVTLQEITSWTYGVTSIANNYLKRTSSGNRIYVHNYIAPVPVKSGSTYTIKLTSGSNNLGNGWMSYTSTSTAYDTSLTSSSCGYPTTRTQGPIINEYPINANTTKTYTFTATANASYIFVICIAAVGANLDPQLSGNIVITKTS